MFSCLNHTQVQQAPARGCDGFLIGDRRPAKGCASCRIAAVFVDAEFRDDQAHVLSFINGLGKMHYVFVACHGD